MMLAAFGDRDKGIVTHPEIITCKAFHISQVYHVRVVAPAKILHGKLLFEPFDHMMGFCFFSLNAAHNGMLVVSPEEEDSGWTDKYHAFVSVDTE